MPDIGFDMERFRQYYFSKNNIIITPEISKLSDDVIRWIKLNFLGGIIYGRSRMGKTWSLYYMERVLHEKLGDDVPVIVWDVESRRPSDNAKFFYSSLLDDMGCRDYTPRDSSYVLKRKIINKLSLRGLNTKCRNVVVLADEAQNLSSRDLSFMIDLYNHLCKNNVQMITLLFGDHRLIELKQDLILNGEEQLVARFMRREHQYKGVTSSLSLMSILRNMETSFPLQCGGHSLHISEDFFPVAYQNGWKIADMAGDIWDAFFEICDQSKNGMEHIPMEYLMKALMYLFMEYGAYGERPVDVITRKHINEAVAETGYNFSPMVPAIEKTAGRKKGKLIS